MGSEENGQTCVYIPSNKEGKYTKGLIAIIVLFMKK